MSRRILLVAVLLTVLTACQVHPVLNYNLSSREEIVKDRKGIIFRERYIVVVYEKDPLYDPYVPPQNNGKKCKPLSPNELRGKPPLPIVDRSRQSDEKIGGILVTHIEELRQYIDELESKVKNSYNDYRLACK